MGRLRGGILAIIALGIALVAYAGGVERRWLAITHHWVSAVRLRPEWEGMRLVHLSDFHIGSPGAPYQTLCQAVAAAIELRPDMILLTGDFSDDGRPRALDILAPLARVAPTFAILGNHDYFKGTVGADAITRLLEAQGITVLRNALATIAYNGVPGTIAGFDATNHRSDADVSMVIARAASDHPHIALVHAPDMIEHFPSRWAGLTLAGHTHGAQIRLSPVRTFDWTNLIDGDKYTRYPRGWYTVNGNILYVNRGLGVAALPLRFAARPEVACITLV
jgi:predicted MPP superfamily phosphohydrolase